MKNIIQLLSLLSMLFLSACTSTSTQYFEPYSTRSTNTDSSGYDKQKAAAARLTLGLSYLAQGDYEKAKFNLDKALVHAPENDDVLRGVAWYYQSVSEPEIAKKFYLKAIQINPKNPELLNQYGVFLCRNNQLQESLEYFSASIKILSNKDIGGTYENAAICNIVAGNIEVAENYYRKALNYNPQQKDSLLGMAKIEYDKGRYKRSRSYISRFENVTKHNPRSLWLAIRTASYLGDMDAVASYALRLVQLFPDSQETENYLDSKNQWLK